MKEDDYSVSEKVMMTLFWYRRFLMGEIETKKSNPVKFRSRKICIYAGMALYAVVILISLF